MKRATLLAIRCVASIVIVASVALAQDPGPQFKKIQEGIYVQSASPANSNCGIIVTSEGVVLIDSGFTPVDSQAVLKAVKQLTPQPIRFLIDTETHGDHVSGHWLFSPPAVIITHSGGAEAVKKNFDPERINTLAKQRPEIREAAQGFRLVTPQVEYGDRMKLNMGDRTLELMYMKNVHSEADTAIWLPKERVLFSASVAVPKSINNLRPFVNIPDMIAAMHMLKALSPEVVVPGHGQPGGVEIFDEAEKYYTLLMDRVGALVKQGKSLNQIKQELRMPEYADWLAQERMPSNIEAAYRAVTVK